MNTRFSTSSRPARAGLVLATLMLACLPWARAATFPERPIHLVVPFPPGASTDLVARIVGNKVGMLLGHPVVIDNRGGAGGSIGSDFVARAAPDGYTLLVATTSHTANPSIYAKLPYDTRRDFSAIALLADMPGLLIGAPDFPPNNFDEFLAYARKTPLQYGSAGAGTFPHLAMEQLRSRAGLTMTHLPYKGAAPALVDLLAGVYQVKVDAYISAGNYVKQKKVKVYAVTSLQRMAQLPDVPTVAEKGFPGFESTYWIGVVGPAGIPPAVRATLENAFVAAVKDPAVTAQLSETGTRAIGEPAARLDALIDRELKLWPSIVKNAGVSLR